MPSIIEELILRMGLDASGVASGMRQAERVVSDGAKKFDSLAGHLFGVSGGAVGAALSFEAFMHAIERAKKVQEMSEALNVSVGTLQAWSAAVTMAGGDTGKANALMAKLAESIGRAADGNEKAAAKFAKFGITVEGLAVSGGDVDAAFNTVADRLSAIENPGQRAAAAFELFGKKAVLALTAIKEYQHLKGDSMFLNEGEVKQLATVGDELETLQTKYGNWVARGYANIWSAFFNPALSDKNNSGKGIKGTLKDAWNTLKTWDDNTDRLARGELFDSELERINKEGGNAQIERHEARKAAVREANEESRKAIQLMIEEADPAAKLTRLKSEQAEKQREIVALTDKGRRGAEEDIRLAKLKVEHWRLGGEISKITADFARKESDEKAKAAAAAEKQAAAERQIAEARVAVSKAEAAVKTARSDRSGWTLSDVANLPLEYDRKGNPLLPPEIGDALSMSKGRRLSRGEIAAAARAYALRVNTARAGMDAEEMAKSLRLTGDDAGAMTDAALGFRGGLDALTETERFPMIGVMQTLQAQDAKLAELLKLANGPGLAIKPRNGE